MKQQEEYIEKCDAQYHKAIRPACKVYMNSAQRKLLIQEVGDSGCILYAYYLEKARVPGFDWSDDKAAVALGWSKYKVQRTRLALIQNDWFYQASGALYDGPKIRITYLGKDTVQAYKDRNHPFWKDAEKLREVMLRLDIECIEDLKNHLSEAKAIWDTL